MVQVVEFVDPFGAPEYFCNDMTLEAAAPGLVKVKMFVWEHGHAILRCTLLLPESVLQQNIARTREFMGAAALMMQ